MAQKNPQEKIKLVECPECVGVGEVYDGAKVSTCDFCKGKGQVDEHKYDYYIGGIEEELSDS